MSEILFDNVWKEYGDHIVLERITLHVASRAFVALVGPRDAERPPSCGCCSVKKARHAAASWWTACLLVPEPDADRGVVFQRYSVFPHLTVLQNVLLGRELEHAKFTGRLFGAARRAAIDEAMALLAEVGLAGHEKQISGCAFRRDAAATGAGAGDHAQAEDLAAR